MCMAIGQVDLTLLALTHVILGMGVAVDPERVLARKRFLADFACEVVEGTTGTVHILTTPGLCYQGELVACEIDEVQFVEAYGYISSWGSGFVRVV